MNQTSYLAAPLRFILHYTPKSGVVQSKTRFFLKHGRKDACAPILERLLQQSYHICHFQALAEPSPPRTKIIHPNPSLVKPKKEFDTHELEGIIVASWKSPNTNTVLLLAPDSSIAILQLRWVAKNYYDFGHSPIVPRLAILTVKDFILNSQISWMKMSLIWGSMRTLFFPTIANSTTTSCGGQTTKSLT